MAISDDRATGATRERDKELLRFLICEIVRRRKPALIGGLLYDSPLSTAVRISLGVIGSTDGRVASYRAGKSKMAAQSRAS